MTDHANTDAGLLSASATLLYGVEWQRPLARALAALHPEGPRGEGYDRVVRRWAAGERSVPPWVWPVLSGLLHDRAAELRGQSREAERLSRSLRERSEVSP